MGYQLIKEAKALEDYRVAVVFDNGESGIFDCKPYMDMGYYKPLKDAALFKCVRVSYGWLNWPGDIDIGADDVWADAERSAPKTARRRTAKRKLAMT